jgi:N-acetylmuramoyl-L-alanine amidase
MVMVALLAAACAGSGGAAITDPRATTTGDPPATTTTAAPAPTTTVAREVGALVTPSGVVVPVEGREGDAWLVRTPCNRPARVTGGRPVSNVTVVLDPGHGGTDPGAVAASGLTEKHVNMEVSRHAQAALEASGVPTLLTRTADYDLELGVRADIAKRLHPQVFVSVHHNAEPDGPFPKPGSETYYQFTSPESKRLAGLVYEEAVRALSPYPISWVADTDAGAKYRLGSRGDYYAMVREPAPVVAVLAEFAFMSNPAEAALLARPDVQKVEGEALARAILRYLHTPDPGSGYTEPYPRPTPPRGPGGPPPPCTDPAL